MITSTVMLHPIFRVAFIALGLMMFSPLHAKTILIVGDSISAGYGMNIEQGWVHLLQQRLNQKYPKQHRVIKRKWRNNQWRIG